MVVLNSGLNKVRDIFANDLYAQVYGTSGTSVSFNNNDLGAEIVGTENTDLTTSVSDKTLVVSSILGPASGNGNTIREWGLEIDSGNTLFNRTLSAGTVKNSNNQVSRENIIYFDRE